MNKNRLITLCLTAFTLWGCGESPAELPGEADVHDTPLTIASATLDVGEKAQTRANPTLGVEGNSIGIFCYYPTNGYNSKKFCKYTYKSASSKWQPADASQTVYVGKLASKVFSVYPWDEGNQNPEVMVLTAHVVANDAEANASYSVVTKADLAAGATSVALNHGHRYAKVKIQIQGTSKTASAVVSDFTLKGIRHKASHNMLTETFTVIDKATPLHITKALTLNTSAQLYAIALVPPAEGEDGNPSYQLTVDGRTLKGTLTKKFTQGTETTLTVTINAKGAEVETVTTESWTEENLDLDGNL